MFEKVVQYAIRPACWILQKWIPWLTRKLIRRLHMPMLASCYTSLNAQFRRSRIRFSLMGRKHVMRKIESAATGIIFGAVPIISGFLAGWWISIPFVPESRIFLCALAGLVLGMIIDMIFLRSWIRHVYSRPPWVWMAVYVFYSIGMFGFFMGVPVFNVMLALPAGVFIGRWLVHIDADATRMQKAAWRTAVFTTSILGLVCILSATIALANRSTASELQSMLRLPFQITPMMLIGIILGGGALMLALEWLLTVKSVERTYAYFVTLAQPVSA